MSEAHTGSEGKLSVIGKNIEVTQPIRSYVAEKLTKVDRLVHPIIDVTVRLDVRKPDHRVDITLRFSHFHIKVGATTDNMYSAIDRAVDRLVAKARKWKDRIRDHHSLKHPVVEMGVDILEGDEEEEEESQGKIGKYSLPGVTKRKTRPLSRLTVTEAMMKMELSGDHFLIYRSEEEIRLKVMYRRRDGSYGIISPE
ncbi:MAG: ribosome-associated translation inhibitor RaiA [Simkaniaceae bacterium]|nr:ribosome-associated translation inhibitor RaiA [Simkaniaceae bacterium]